MKPAVAGEWEPAGLDDVELDAALASMQAGLRGIRVFRRVADGAMAFVRRDGLELVHLVWREPAGLVCICPVAERPDGRNCSALALINPASVIGPEVA